MKQYLLFVVLSVFSTQLFSQAEEWELFSFGNTIEDFVTFDSVAVIASSNGLVITDLNNSENFYVDKEGFDINSNQVLNCYYSPSGYIYFSTDYYIYKVSPDLESFSQVLGPAYARDLLVDDDEVLWFSNNYSLMRFENDNLVTYDNIYDEINDIYLSGAISHLISDTEGNIWICGENGIAKFDGTSFTVYNYINSPIPQYTEDITAFVFDQNNNIWIYCLVDEFFGTSVLLKFDGSNWLQFDHLTTPLPSPEEIYVSDLEVDENNNLWVLSYKLLKFDGTSWFEYLVPVPEAYSTMTYDDFGNTWFTSYQQLYKYDGIESQEINYSKYEINGWYSTSIFIDNENTKWISTTDGIVVFNDTSWNTSLYIDGLPENRVYKIAGDQNENVWIVSEDEIIRIDDVGNWTETEADDIPEINFHLSSFSEIVCDSINDIVWFGGGNGAGTDGSYLIKYHNGIFTGFSDENSALPIGGINDMDIDQSGQLWIATPIGIYKFDGENQWAAYNSSNTNLEYSGISSIAVDDYGIIWFAYESSTYMGFGRFDGTNVIDFYEFPYSHVNDIEFDQYGNTWFANLYGGIIKYRNGYHEIYNTNNSNIGVSGVRDVYVDSPNSDIWVAGEYGFSRFHPDNNLNPDSIRICGFVFLDENGNGIYDTDEFPLTGHKVRLFPDNSLTFTNADGKFTFLVDTGTYVVSYQIEPNWQLSSPMSTYNVEAYETSLNGFDFGVTGINDNVDFATDLACLNPSRCDAQTLYNFSFRNEGTQVADALLQIEFDQLLSPENSYPPANIISGNTFSWDFEDLVPGNLYQVNILLMMPDFNFMGDTIVTRYNFNASNIDNSIIYHAEDSLLQEIICSYDPNDKSAETSGPLFLGNNLLTDTLIYTIRFQNTGNDTAFIIQIVDMLDYNIDLSSFEFISSSHNVIVDLKQNHELRFIFDSIMLPDSVVNEPFSHGFVKYQVKLKSNTPNYTVIRNTAQIFFDNNPAVITNTTLNTIIDGEPAQSQSHFSDIHGYKLFPNPFTERAVIIVENENFNTLNIVIFDITGKIVLIDEFSTLSYFLKRSDLNTGLYFFNIFDPDSINVIRGKFIIK